MMNNYKCLSHHLLSVGSTINHAHGVESKPITLADKASMVLTDFRYNRPFWTTPTATIDQVQAKMIACGVRMLFVAENDGQLLGLITHTDVSGEKPVRYVQEHGGGRGDIFAQEVMTPLTEIEALRRKSLTRAKVGDIVKTLMEEGRRHLLVTSEGADGTQIISGLFSSTHVEHMLGIKIKLSTRANTFVDIERALIE